MFAGGFASMASVAASLHSARSSMSPTGKFGSEVTTEMAPCRKITGGRRRGEKFYEGGMRRMMDLDVKSQGCK